MIPKIVSIKDREEKAKRMKVWLSVIIVVILAASTASYALYTSPSTTSQNFNGFKFYLGENGWKGKDFNFYTVFHPEEVLDVPLNGVPGLGDFSVKTYLILPSSGSRNAAGEFANAVPMQSIQIACLPEDADLDSCKDLPLKDCNNAGPDNAVAIFRDSENETFANYAQWCLQVSGDDIGMLKAVDKLIYSMYGVIKE